jgi:dTDP-4-amino-4,6-dideoxygalactose transaminase
MSEVASAAGSVQLRKLDSLNEKRRQIGHRLNEGLAHTEGIRVQQEPEDYRHIYHLYVFFYQPLEEGSNREKEEVIRILDEEEGIKIENRYFPIHLLPEIRAQGHHFGECPVAEKIWFEQHVNLPIFPAMQPDQVETMIEAVARTVKRVRGLRR